MRTLANQYRKQYKFSIRLIQQEYQKGIILKVITDNDKIIGSVRAYCENGTVYIGKLMRAIWWNGKLVFEEMNYVRENVR